MDLALLDTESLAANLDRSDLHGTSLETLAEEARWHKEQAEVHHRQSLWHFVEMGRRLIEAKARLAHGAFVAHVTAEVGVSVRMGQYVMEAARNTQRVAYLAPETSLRQALEVIHEQKREERAVARAAADPLPVELPDYLPCAIEVADAAALPLPDGLVDLIVTSPPYGLGIGYTDSDDDQSYGAYIAQARAWAAEMLRVATAQGRLCLNVPLDCTRGGQRAMYADWLDVLRAAGWIYETTMIWMEGNVSKQTARGSVDSPSAPHVMTPVETIVVARKGEWNLHRIGPHDLRHEEWLEWTSGVWTFPGESPGRVDHPAPFPERLPQQCIGLFSFRDAVVCDPFVGSGTTAVVAYRMGRTFYGFDTSTKYVQMARARVARELAA